MAKKPEKMDATTFSAFVQAEVEDARSYSESDLRPARLKAEAYFRGEMDDMPAEKGWSSAVSTDIADVMGFILPGVMRVFEGSQIVEYQPHGPEDEPQAKQATDYVNFLWQNRLDGYRVLSDAAWDAILHGNGILCAYWCPPEEETAEYENLTDDELTVLVQDPSVTVQQHSQNDDGTHELKVSHKTKLGKLAARAVRPEKFLIARDATAIHDARMCGEIQEPTRSELIERGYDTDKVFALAQVHDTTTSTQEAAARLGAPLIGRADSDAGDPSGEKVELFELYVRVDMDGDGITELRRIVCAFSGDDGGDTTDEDPITIFENDEWDYVPYCDLISERVPHRWKGRGLYDDIGMLQRIKTAVTRQTLDNLYLNNHPLTQVLQNSVVNPAALMNRKIGEPVFVKSPEAITYNAVPFVAKESFAMLEYLDRVRAQRTGISEQSMGLDPDALQNETATAVQVRQAGQFARVELIARNFAEMGLKEFFRLCLKLLCKYQDQQEIVRLRGNWVPMDPRAWNADMDCVVNVGLGSGSKDRDIANLGAIAQKQEAIIERAGPANPVLPIGVLIKTYQRMAEAAGIKNADAYFPDVTQEAMQQLQQQSQQNPEAQKLQAQMQMQQQQMQSEMAMRQQEAQSDAQLEQEKAEKQATVEQQQAQADLAVQRQKTDMEMQLAQQRFDLEKQLKLIEAGLKVHSTMRDQTRKDEDAAAPDSPNGAGDGDLAQALAMIGQGLHAFAQAHAAPKRAVKMPDGSFVMQPVEAQPA